MESKSLPPIITTYRYAWTISKDSDHINFKYVTDLAEGIAAFEKALLESNPYSVIREYVSQFDCSRVNEQVVLKSSPNIEIEDIEDDDAEGEE